MMLLPKALRRDERTLLQRFEMKYLITETVAEYVKCLIAPYVFPDEHGPSYPVASLYLDGPGMPMYWSSTKGEKNRHKLRIRSYSADLDSPVFLEIKRRIDQVVKKQSTAVLREHIPRILDLKEAIGPEVLPVADNRKAMAQVLYFRECMIRFMAAPRVMVRYEREAFTSAFAQPVRVTFDRRLSGLPSCTYTPRVWEPGAGWRPVYEPSVILELKFTDTFPGWLQDVVRKAELIRDSYAKYSACVEMLWREGFSLTHAGE